jgi:hypothetical protein
LQTAIALKLMGFGFYIVIACDNVYVQREAKSKPAEEDKPVWFLAGIQISIRFQCLPTTSCCIDATSPTTTGELTQQITHSTMIGKLIIVI